MANSSGRAEEGTHFSTVTQHCWKNQVGISSSPGHRVTFVWKAEMKAGRSPETEDTPRTNAVTVGEFIGRREKLRLMVNGGNGLFCRSGVPVV